jgi:DNA repair protein RadD
LIPRYYQTEANDAAWKYLNEQAGNPLIVLPTGAGKSLVIAMLCQQAIEFGCRVVVLQHRRELIVQNTEKIQILMPEIKIGIFSAGLKSRQVEEDVVCAGIQSVYRKAFNLGRRELILIDEAHLVSSSDETMYGQFLSDIKTANPQQRVIGLTATPFRTGDGPLCGRNKLFQRICHESYTGDLIQQGFLCPITNKPADRMVDTSLIKTRGGEFIEHDAQLAFDTTDNVSAACAEIVTKCHDRKSVLVFASGVGHAEHITDTLSQMTGQNVMMVTGETFPMERAAILADFKAGRLRWLVNCDVLTTGFDAPCIDAICVLRATMSPGLFAQMVGRGLRKHESKSETIVLDFGENIFRHGSLDDRNYGRASESSGRGSGTSQADNNGRGKECPNCGQDVAARSAECLDCGFVFPVKHESSADHESQITGQTPPEVWTVCSVGCARHTKRNDPEAHPTLRIDYDCQQDGMMKQTISEWVCIQHSGYARTKAGLWWQARSLLDCPDDITEAIDLIRRGALRNPATITTERDGKYFRIKSVEFSEEKPTAWREADEPVEVLSEGGDGFDDEAPF